MATVGRLLTFSLVLVLVTVEAVLATPPDPEEFAAYLHAVSFHSMLTAFIVGIGFGLLVKMLNRS